MNTFLQLPSERRRLAFLQVDESMGLQSFLFFGETPSFKDLMTAAAEFERIFNATAQVGLSRSLLTRGAVNSSCSRLLRARGSVYRSPERSIVEQAQGILKGAS